MVLILPAVPGSLAVARQALAGFALAAGADPQVVDDIRVALTEACTNVVVHAYPDGGGEMEIAAWAVDSGVRVRVADRGRGLVPGAPSDGLGLGVSLMASLAREARVAVRDEGGVEVVMTFDLDVPPDAGGGVP
jgi:anti-sigma regulatory factor (Ser/Thr protein kinase)